MLSPKYFALLIQDIRAVVNPDHTPQIDKLIQIKSRKFFETEETIYYEDKEPDEKEIAESALEKELEKHLLDHLKNKDIDLNYDENNFPALGVVIGLDKELFPEDDVFSEEQLQQINSEFQKMLRSYRIAMFAPECVDPKLVYSLFRSHLSETVFIDHPGIIIWDWCSKDSQTCPYLEDCRCRVKEHEINNCLSDAKNALRALQVNIRSLMKEGVYFKYNIDHTLDINDDLNTLSCFISQGIPDIPREVALFPHRWKSTIRDLKEFLKHCPELADLFDENEMIIGAKNLEIFLSFNTLFDTKPIYRIAPFFIDGGLLYKGYIDMEDDVEDDDVEPDFDPNDDDELPF